jgi:hypothetical protein
MHLIDPQEPLSRALARWRIEPAPDPGFRPAVWQRIHHQPRASWAGYLQAHLATWAVVALVGISGAGWVGHSAGQARLAAERDAMVTTYLVELDPRVQAVLRPEAP